MKNNFIVVAFYTKGTPYEDEIKILQASLDAHGLDYYFFAEEPLGDWVRNVNLKPKVILKAMDMFTNRDILYLDSDAVVNQYPRLIEDIEEPIGVNYFRNDPDSLYGSIIFFKNTPQGRSIARLWLAEIEKFPNIDDQRALNFVIRSNNLPHYKLPAAYGNIFDLVNVENPVVTHNQASRRFKWVVTNDSRQH